MTPLLDPVYTDLLTEGVSSHYYQRRRRAYLKKGRYEPAVREFQMALQPKPSVEAYYDLGLTIQFLGKHKEAINYVEKALKLNPNYPRFYLDLA